MNSKTNMKMYSILPLIVILLMVSGCLERQEEIVIDEMGNATITSKIEGNQHSLDSSIALPSPATWEIISDKIDAANSDKPKRKFEAKITIPYGQPLPASYDLGNAQKSIYLQFPSEIKFWRDGNRTFYEFKRTYQNRLFFHYNGSDDLFINKELEEKITEIGIFNASEEDRNQYLKDLCKQFSFQHMMLAVDALNQMIVEFKLPLATKKLYEDDAIKFLEGSITPEVVIELFKLDEEEMEIAFNNLINKTIEGLKNIYSKHQPDGFNYTKNDFGNIIAEKQKYTKVTEKLDTQEFGVYLAMPGTIVATNGIVDIDDGREVVVWGFKGDSLHDHDIPLYALSVVEH